MAENAVMTSQPEIFQDDDFLPDLDLDIVTTSRPEYAEGWQEKVARLCTKCDLWKIIPTTMVSSAFSFSITVLTTCSLATLTTSKDSVQDSISFGLWSYTDPDLLRNGTLFTPFQISSPECRAYDPSQTNSVGLSENGLSMDVKFQTAKAFGVLAVCIGFLTMASLWMGVLRDYESTTNWRRWVGGGLLLCCLFQGMTLLLLESEVCHSNSKALHRHCQIGSGANWVIAACSLWFVSGFVLIKWPRAKEYVHSSLAADESDASKHDYPAEVAEDYEYTWNGIMRSLGSEEVEMKQYRDYPEEVENRNDPPRIPQQSSSLRDLLLGFGDELSLSREPEEVKIARGRSPQASSEKAAATLEVTPSPQIPFTPQSAMERLRKQSSIQASQSPQVSDDSPTAAKSQVLKTDERPNLQDGNGLKRIHSLKVPPTSRTFNFGRSGLRGMLETHTTPQQKRERQSTEPSTLSNLLDAFDDDSL